MNELLENTASDLLEPHLYDIFGTFRHDPAFADDPESYNGCQIGFENETVWVNVWTAIEDEDGGIDDRLTHEINGIGGVRHVIAGMYGTFREADVEGLTVTFGRPLADRVVHHLTARGLDVSCYQNELTVTAPNGDEFYWSDSTPTIVDVCFAGQNDVTDVVNTHGDVHSIVSAIERLAANGHDASFPCAVCRKPATRYTYEDVNFRAAGHHVCDVHAQAAVDMGRHVDPPFDTDSDTDDVDVPVPDKRTVKDASRSMKKVLAVPYNTALLIVRDRKFDLVPEGSMAQFRAAGTTIERVVNDLTDMSRPAELATVMVLLAAEDAFVYDNEGNVREFDVYGRSYEITAGNGDLPDQWQLHRVDGHEPVDVLWKPLPVSTPNAAVVVRTILSVVDPDGSDGRYTLNVTANEFDYGSLEEMVGNRRCQYSSIHDEIDNGDRIIWSPNLAPTGFAPSGDNIPVRVVRIVNGLQVKVGGTVTVNVTNG